MDVDESGCSTLFHCVSNQDTREGLCQDASMSVDLLNALHGYVGVNMLASRAADCSDRHSTFAPDHSSSTTVIPEGHSGVTLGISDCMFTEPEPVTQPTASRREELLFEPQRSGALKKSKLHCSKGV